MPVTTTDSTTPVERKKPPRRSWRHLPASPPVADPLPLPDAADLVGSGVAVEAGGDGGDTALQTAVVPAVEPPRRRRPWLVAAAVVATIAIVAAAVLTLRDDSQPSAARTSTTATAGANGSGGASGSVQDIVKKVSPAVVQLEVQGGIGAGVVFDKGGLILTAHHVVAGTEELTVKLADGSEIPGRVVGRMADRDLAIVAVQHDGDLAAADLAGDNTVEVGEPVVAIGSPFGIAQTVTSGIVSGLDREIDSPVGKLTGLIQTDAPINPGNSGGPLIDGDAKVIGINSAIASTSGASAGVGFAVPVSAAKDLIQQVRDAGGVTAPAVPDDSSSSAGGGGGGPLDGLVPPGLRDLLPDGLDGLLNGTTDPVDVLQRLLEQLLNGGLDGLNPFAPDQGGSNGSTPDQVQPEQSLGLIDIGSLPDGWTQGRNSVNTSSTPNGVEGTQDIVLEGPNGRVAIVAQRGPDAAKAYDRLDGDATTVAGTKAKALAGGGLAWMASDNVLVTLKADAGVADNDVSDIAGAIQVVR